MSSEPAFHSIFVACPTAVNLLLNTQIQSESTVKDGVFYEWRTPGGAAEMAIGELLHNLLGKVDPRFPGEINPYWTLQLRIARKSTSSRWYQHAIGLPTGITRIKRVAPTYWMGNRVTSWSDVAEIPLLIY